MKKKLDIYSLSLYIITMIGYTDDTKLRVRPDISLSCVEGSWYGRPFKNVWAFRLLRAGKFFSALFLFPVGLALTLNTDIITYHIGRIYKTS